VDDDLVVVPLLLFRFVLERKQMVAGVRVPLNTDDVPSRSTGDGTFAVDQWLGRAD
jgi:hypothetical protein